MTGLGSSCDFELRLGILKLDSADFGDTGVEGEEDLRSVKGEGENVLRGRLVPESMLHEPVGMSAVLDKETFSNMFSRKHMSSE